MNALDWALLAIVAVAAVRGFFRGFVVELASLLGVVAGIWAASRFSARVAAWAGLEGGQEWAGFAITFVAVLVLVHLLAKVITKAMDLAMLGLPNKVAGGLFGAVRSAFVLSVLLNLFLAWPRTAGLLSAQAREGSLLCSPLRAFAPLILPAVRDSSWVREAIHTMKVQVRGEQDGEA